MSYRRKKGKRGRGLFKKGKFKSNNHHWGDSNSNSLTTKQSRKQRLKDKLEAKKNADSQDIDFGFERYIGKDTRLGWLLNIVPTVIPHTDTNEEQSGLDFYFITGDGNTFKASTVFYPYFYVYCAEEMQHALEQFLVSKYEQFILKIEIQPKIDLDLKNHLSGLKKSYLQLFFYNESDMRSVVRDIKFKVAENKTQKKNLDAYGTAFFVSNTNNSSKYSKNLSRDELFESHMPTTHKTKTDLMTEIIDIREYDVSYISRVCIDLNIRVGKWYDVVPGVDDASVCTMSVRSDIEIPPDVKIMAFDIETTKPPLKFPTAEFDEIMMISYMIDTDGYLIVNRKIVSEDIDDFEYTPKPEFEGIFTVFNEDDEVDLLRRFFEHIRDERPHVYVTYNGDFFDWPFIETRAEFHDLDMRLEIGVWPINGIYLGRFNVHLDCFAWVQRDSYLPQGSQSLKAVTRYKLGYNPVELDPEDMLPFAKDNPHELATYSVSDAVATYYLFKKYIESFIFSLCQIVPMNSGNVLRKGSGTLCEQLLMVQAYEKNIIAPNKTVDKSLKFYNGHVLDSETYIGGTVEAFESGVFRHDIPVRFVIEPEAIDELIASARETLEFAVVVENKLELSEILNFEEVALALETQLRLLRNTPRIEIEPLIYHLDVAAMYPNIILTNRLQPTAVVTEEICAACDFNRPGMDCQRKLQWKWRGSYMPASKGEFNQLRAQSEYMSIDSTKVEFLTWKQQNRANASSNNGEALELQFSELNQEQQNTYLRSTLKVYCQKVYKKRTISEEQERESVVCQRENGFYVDTVRDFRDRRYIYKGLVRSWKGKFKKAQTEIAKADAMKFVTVYDSLQLAHKCILNSFYGYVMRRGARWYSMDMAAITTNIGGTIIRDAHELCARIGRPLELDTDGIWTMLPSNFPQNFHLKTTNPNKSQIEVEYPGSMLNLRTHQIYTNTQHQTLVNEERFEYETKSECSIFFEVDGPYRCMVMPASTEEGRKLKKRYAVFNFDGSLAELKGFEIKRRGELNIIKIFQKEVFKTFLKGSTLVEVYDAVAQVGKRWLDILDTRAKELSDAELLNLITASKNMSKKLSEYGVSKSTAITCAKRLAQFLGAAMVKDSGLACKFVISAKPIGHSVSERAVPVAIFSAQPSIMKQYLKRWLHDSNISDFDIRSILDWDYYKKRLGGNLQKIITIPAAMQRVDNPLPQLAHPTWLQKVIAEKNDPYQQQKITSFFTKTTEIQKPKPLAIRNSSPSTGMHLDMEDFEHPLSYNNKKNGKQRSQSRMDMNATMNLNEQSVLNDSMFQDSEMQEDMMIVGGGNNHSAAEPAMVKVTETMDANFDSWLGQTKNLWQKQQPALQQRLLKRKRKRSQRSSPVDSNSNESRKKRKSSVHFNLDDYMSDEDEENGGQRSGSVGGGVAQYFQRKLLELHRHPWQIIQVVETGSHGKFILWVITDNKNIQRIDLHVKRPFYVNVIKLNSFPHLQKKGQLTTRALPRSRPSLHLLRFDMVEQEFREQSKLISMFLTHPHIEGVYETHVPLLFRIISQIGCCTAVSQQMRNKKKKQSFFFQLSELEFRSTSQQLYFDGEKFNMLHAAKQLQIRNENKNNDTKMHAQLKQLSRESIKYVYVYHSQSQTHRNMQKESLLMSSKHSAKKKKKGKANANANANANKKGRKKNAKSDQRGIFGIFWQNKKHSLHQFLLTVIVIKTNKKAQIESFDVGKYVRQLIAKFKLEHYANVQIRHKVITVKSLELAFTEMSNFFDSYVRLLNGESIVLWQSHLELHQLYQKVPVIAEKFPVVCIPFPESNNFYPPLQWYTHAVKQMTDAWMIAPQELETFKGFARYSHVPIGNMPPDIWNFTSDVFFSRLLSDAKHLWWISNSSRPDLGGLEEDENLFDDEHRNPIINNPGAYHTMCIELEIGHLATNTILQSEHIQALEMSAGGDAAAGDLALVDRTMQDEIKENFVKSSIRIDDASSCMSSFKILKKLINNWCGDVGGSAQSANKFRQVYADRLLVEFYRWLRSPSSMLYDPLLHRMVHRLMSKVFYQLIAQFKKLGAKIIYASFDRIIIETGKNRMQNMVGYVRSCLDSIKKHELFEWILLSPTNNWECLLWFDHANFGGYLLQAKEFENDEEITPEERFLMHNFDRELESRWNFASFLPTLAEDIFEAVVGSYLVDIRNEYRRLLGIDVDDDDDDNNESGNATQNVNETDIEVAVEEEKAQSNAKRILKKRKGGEDDNDNDVDVDRNALELADDDLFDDEDEDEAEEKAAPPPKKKTPAKKIVSARKNVSVIPAELRKEFANYKNNMIENRLAAKLFQYITRIHHQLRPDTSRANVQAEVFPFRPGSHLPLQIPSLEFIKYVCAVLSLDNDIAERVSVLKRNLLKMIEIGYFSAQATFYDPCQTYILPDVNCFKCKQSRDLDLCRDEFTKPESMMHHLNNVSNDSANEKGVEDEYWNIKCHYCGNLYDKDLVESMLLEVAKRRETAFHVQDIVCNLCLKTKMDDMSEYCNCSGSFHSKLSAHQFEDEMLVFQNIATIYNFPFLRDTMEWILKDKKI